MAEMEAVCIEFCDTSALDSDVQDPPERLHAEGQWAAPAGLRAQSTCPEILVLKNAANQMRSNLDRRRREAAETPADIWAWAASTKHPTTWMHQI